MQKTIQKTIAVFIIGLIIAMPAYSSAALAALSSPKVYGADSINGYLRRGETVFFNITAEISGDTDISPSQVHLIDLSGPQFNACFNIINNRFACEYFMSSSSISGNTFSFNALLYNDNNQLVLPKASMNGAFDELAPEIRAFAISPSVTKGPAITISYDVYDHAYSITDSGKCTGLNKIEFSNSGNVFYTVNVNSPPGNCARAGSIAVPVSNITSSDGIKDITLTAYDNFNQASSSVAQFTYDTTPSIINTGSLRITDNNGNDLGYIGNSPINGKIRFYIPSSDLNPNSVYGDITEINKDSHPEYLNMQAVCSAANNGGYNCTFNNVEVKLDHTTNVNIRINSSDLANNPSSAALEKTIYYDAAGPSITSIRTELVNDDGISYVGNNLNTFVVEFSEDGIGVDKNSMRLGLSNINSGLSSKAANECANSVCYWRNITSNAADGNKTISVLSSSSDKLGNLVTGTLSVNVTVDRTAPVPTASDLSSIGTETEAIPNKIKTTDKISLKTTITEKSTLRAYADFSSLVTSQGNESGSCTKGDGDKWQCEWATEPIDVPGFIQAKIPVTYNDFAGNAYTKQYGIKVYNYSSRKNPSYWTHSVSCAPSNVDRQVTSFVNYKVFCSITLIPLTADQEALSMSFENCEDRIEGSTAYIASSNLINSQAGSTAPFLSLSLSQSEMRIDKISLKCPIGIITRAGNEIMKNPETENVNVDISFYNMPLGEFDTNTLKKIKDVENEAAVGWEWISILKEILFYAEKICQILGIYSKLVNALGLLETATEGWPGVGTLTAKAARAAEKGTAGQVPYLTPFCKYISCDYTLWGNWYTGQQSLWKNNLREPGRGFAQSGDKKVGKLENLLNKYDLGTPWPESPKDSLVLSIFTGCLPGIIYNIEKWRQIQCNYGVCLMDSAANNIPIKVCEDQKNYLVCNFIAGQVFQLLPIWWIRGILEKITYILSDPMALLFGFIGMLCPEVPGVIHGTCATIRGLTMLLEVSGDIERLFDSKSWEIQGDMCEIYFDGLEKLEKQEKA